MKKALIGLLVAALLGAFVAVPNYGRAVELPTCESLGYPTDPSIVCTGPTEPTATTTDTSAPPPTGPQGPTGPIAADPQYNWVWNGTAWEAEGYPYVWNGTSWVPRPAPKISASNTDTGPGSENTASADSSNTTDANLANNATIDNTITGNLNTGNNTVSYNTNAGNLTSGNIKATVELMNFINSILAVEGGTVTFADFSTTEGDIDLTRVNDPRIINAILAYYVGSIFEILANNTNTGPASSNAADSSATNNTDINSVQNASVNNTVDLTANTGNNTASYNTAVGNLTTGNIDVVVNLVNIINSILSVPILDIAMVNVFGNLFGNIFVPDWSGNGGATISPQIGASNDTTGPHSSNTANGSAGNTVNVNVVNGADINNGVNLNANTGGNNMSNNTTAGNLTTGNVNVQLTLSDIIRQITGDSWFLIFVNVLGQWTGEILGIDGANGDVFVISPSLLAANSNTGPESTNQASASADNNLNVDSDFNAAINNNLNLNLNTGNNTVAYNTTAGNLTTGNINVLGNIMNVINQAINLNKKLFLGFVNIFGNWFGSIGPRSAFPPPGVGGEPNAASIEQSAKAATAAPTTVSGNGGTQAASARRGPTYSSSPEIGSGESVAFNEVSTMTLPEADEGPSAIAAWKIIALVLLGIGLVLLIVDGRLARRRLN